MIRAEADQPLLDAIGTQWNPFLAEGSRSRTYQEAADAPILGLKPSRTTGYEYLPRSPA